VPTEDLISISLGKNVNIKGVDTIIARGEEVKPNNFNESQNNSVINKLNNKNSEAKKENGMNKGKLII
jgi:hypothetical protein